MAFQVVQLCRGKLRIWFEVVEAASTAASMRIRYGLSSTNLTQHANVYEGHLGNSSTSSTASDSAFSELAKQFAHLEVHLLGKMLDKSDPRGYTECDPGPPGLTGFYGDWFCCGQPGHRASECASTPRDLGNGLEQQ